MAIDFPNSPQVNDIYTYGSQQWKWTGTAWDLVVTAVVGPTGPTGAQGAGLTIAGQYNSSAELMMAYPNGPLVAGASYLVQGDLWVWETITGEWVNVGRVQGPTGATGAKGDTGNTGATGAQGATAVSYTHLTLPTKA